MAPPRKTAAAKVASPRAQARKATAAAIEPTEILPAKKTARTRTSTAGAEARTATRPRGRTAAAKTVVTGLPEPADTPAAPTAEPDEVTGGVEEADLSWRGRTIRIRLPNLEQLTIYRRLSARFAGLADASKKPGAEPMSMEEATRHYDRAIKLITSVFVHREDIDWLEDEMLERRLELADAGELLRLAFDRLHTVNDEAQNRTQRRAATRRARLAD